MTGVQLKIGIFTFKGLYVIMKTLKIISHITTIALFAVFAFSCQKEIDCNSNVCFTGELEGLDFVKSALVSQNKVIWETSDQVIINGVKFNVTPRKENASKADFSKSNKYDTDPSAPYKAYYPSAIYNNGNPTLPAVQHFNDEYCLAQVCPMYAESNSENLQFKNITGLLELTLKGPESRKIRTIVISSTNLGMSGSFEIVDGAAVVSGSNGVTLDCGSDGVSLSETGVNFYISLPQGAYQGLKFVITATDGMVCEGKAGNTALIARNTIYNITATPSFAKPRPAGELPGLFSVGENTRVHFSKGNLWCNSLVTASTAATWGFEDYQYDYRTWNGLTAISAGAETVTQENHVGLFYWTRKKSLSYTDSYNDPNKKANDTFFADDVIDGWRTLTKDEWKYLLYERNKAGEKIGPAFVAGIRGIIILPDSFNDPEKNFGSEEFESGFGQWESNQYTADNWIAMEKSGAVFLPAVPVRYHNGVSYLVDPGYYGSYWSSTPNTTEHSNFYDSDMTGRAWSIYFSSSEIRIECCHGDAVTAHPWWWSRNSGRAIRLVSEE